MQVMATSREQEVLNKKRAKRENNERLLNEKRTSNQHACYTYSRCSHTFWAAQGPVDLRAHGQTTFTSHGQRKLSSGLYRYSLSIQQSVLKVKGRYVYAPFL